MNTEVLATILTQYGVTLNADNPTMIDYVYMTGGITDSRRYVELRWSKFGGFSVGTTGCANLGQADVNKYAAELFEVRMCIAQLEAAGFTVKP